VNERRELSDADLATLHELAASARHDLWAGAHMLRGAPPKYPTVTALPTAAVEYAYATLVLIGTPDIAYACLRNAGGAWGWRVVATG